MQSKPLNTADYDYSFKQLSGSGSGSPPEDALASEIVWETGLAWGPSITGQEQHCFLGSTGGTSPKETYPRLLSASIPISLSVQGPLDIRCLERKQHSLSGTALPA